MKKTLVMHALIGLVAAVAVLVPQAANASERTVASWHMNEGEDASTMRDATSNGNDGDISSKVDTGETGYKGNAYEFDGDGGLVKVPDDSTLDPGSSPYVVAVYFKSSTKPSSSVGDYDLVRKGLGTTSGGDWKVEVLRGGQAFCHFRGSSRAVNLTGDSNVVDGSWHRLVCRSTSSGVRLLVDGHEEASTSKKPGTISNSSILTVGAKNSHDDETTGLLDEVLIRKG